MNSYSRRHPVVLIFCPAGEEGGAVSRAFEQLGWCTHLVVTAGASKESGVSAHVRNLAARLSMRRVERRLMARRFNSAVQAGLSQHIGTRPPDLMLFMKGHELRLSTREWIEGIRAPKALWTYDSFARFPGQGAVASIVDRVFVMDSADRLRPSDVWLPLGYDEQLYRPRGEPYEYDVTVVGRVKSAMYQSRMNTLLELADSVLPTKFRCCFVGSTGRRSKDRALSKRIPFAFLGTLPRAKYAATIRRSRICINVHQDDGNQPVNPTFFAVPGARVCQVCDDRRYLAEWLIPGQHYVPYSGGSLAELVESLLLDHPRWSGVSSAGFDECRSRHTYVARVRSILSSMGLSRSIDEEG